jgi:ElaB/YqjD/DUF883 family membrane-anchored ribosome-binding protein
MRSFKKLNGGIKMSVKNTPSESDYSDVTKEQLIADFKVVVSDVETLLKATASESSEKFANLRIKAEESLASAKFKMLDVQDTIIEKFKYAAKATDDYVQDNPWQSVGIAAAVGVIVGLLIGRR